MATFPTYFCTAPKLFRARLLVPVAAPPLEDGGVLVEDGRVVACGRFRDLAAESAAVVEVDGIVTPGLVNAHTHLELSCHRELGGEADGWHDAGDGMPGWIAALLARRAEGPAPDEAERAAHEAWAALGASGVALAADIGNGLAPGWDAGRMDGPEVLFFLELLGLSRASAEAAFARLAELPPEVRATAHAPYSTAPDVAVAIKERARALGHPFPIHVAESSEEVEYLLEGSGKFAEFLGSRGVLDGSFTPPGLRPVAYLDRLGVLDRRTLCVHCVQVGAEEIRILADRGASVCLCPGSNRRLGVGRAPAPALFAKGINLALGTDSLASNPALDLWREMRALMEDHPGLDPEAVFAMATLGGARALGVDAAFGVIAPGARARLLAVPAAGVGLGEVFAFLATAADSTSIRWLV